MSKIKSLLIVFIAYIIAISAGIIFIYTQEINPLYEILLADIIATLVIYIFSNKSDNITKKACLYI